jgi:hypothetical protein
MGLDMYLRAKKHISNFDFYPEERAINQKIKEAAGLGHLNSDDASIQLTIGIAYWRKANQIHSWFVENCQDGIDECQDSYVSRDQLTELRDLCAKALETKDGTLLEPRSGFFFGSTEIDDWYWEDLEHTKKVLTDILEDEALKDFQFEYHSSW